MWTRFLIHCGFPGASKMVQRSMSSLGKTHHKSVLRAKMARRSYFPAQTHPTDPFKILFWSLQHAPRCLQRLICPAQSCFFRCSCPRNVPIPWKSRLDLFWALSWPPLEPKNVVFWLEGYQKPPFPLFSFLVSSEHHLNSIFDPLWPPWGFQNGSEIDGVSTENASWVGFEC